MKKSCHKPDVSELPHTILMGVTTLSLNVKTGRPDRAIHLTFELGGGGEMSRHALHTGSQRAGGGGSAASNISCAPAARWGRQAGRDIRTLSVCLCVPLEPQAASHETWHECWVICNSYFSFPCNHTRDLLRWQWYLVQNLQFVIGYTT
jgi:hypothetical protein